MFTRRKIKKRLRKTKRNYKKDQSIVIIEDEKQCGGEPIVKDEEQSVGEPIVKDEEQAIEEPFEKDEEPFEEPFEKDEEQSVEEPFEKDEEQSVEEPFEEDEEQSVEEPFEEQEETYLIDKIYQEEIPNIPMTSEWRMDLNTKENKIPVMVYLELHGIGKKSLKKFMVDHILDSMPHEDRLSLAKHVKNPAFIPTKPLERHILEYFDFLTIKDGEKTYIVLGNTCYNLNNNWSIIIIDENDAVYRNRFFVDSDQLSDIFGYVENEKFKIDGHQCSTKTEMIKHMNEILQLAGSNFWYDVATTKEKPQRNSDNLSNASFCAVTELYLRKLNLERVNNKIWFLKPEQFKRSL
jgi:hypothetical protein